MIRISVVAILWGFMAGSAAADPVTDVMATAQAGFDRMPTLQEVPQISGTCGANDAVNQDIAYCTTSNAILISSVARARPESAYLVAHLLGHAIQVQHGIADIALREILRRPSEEATLRSYVAGQVDCIAGFLYAQAGLPPASLTTWFADEPFTGTHWGRNPLRVGPQVAVGLAARDNWFQTGQNAETLRACTVGEFGAELLLDAYRG